MADCIFCKIAAGEIEVAKLWEDEKYIAFLDINPNTKGMSLVITKEHYGSDVFDLSDEVASDLLFAAKKTAKMLEKGLNVKRVALVAEGMGINHVHLKLYPLHGLDNKFQEMWGKDKVYFSKYEGYIDTRLGEERELSELKKITQEIKERNANDLS